MEGLNDTNLLDIPFRIYPIDFHYAVATCVCKMDG